MNSDNFGYANISAGVQIIEEVASAIRIVVADPLRFPVWDGEIRRVRLHGFPYMVYFPASLLVGLPVNVGQGLFVMVGWGSVFSILNRWLWNKGLKQYSGMGA